MKRKPEIQHGQGIRGLDRAGWVAVARPAVLDLVDTQLAVPHAELEARLWEQPWQDPNTGRKATFFPHILSEAVHELTAAGLIEVREHATKGGTALDLIVPGDTTGRATYIDRAVRRKGMLYGRFLRWSQTEFGPAGEHVVRASLTDASATGYLPISPGFGEVAALGTVRVNGPLDSGAWMLVPDLARQHLPTPHALLFEIKNRRLTLYPRHPEVHQLLYKAALLQATLPGQPIVPVLVCRRAHKWLFWMAKDLGFIVHDTKAQYLTLPDKTPLRYLEEVRDELALHDLKLVSPDSQPRIGNLFTQTLPAQARPVATRWSQVGVHLLDHYKNLRDERLKQWERSDALTALRTEAGAALDQAGIPEDGPDHQILAWALEEEP
jgi:hypothetical protein